MHLQTFYDSHKKQLEDSYPGIKLTRLQQELDAYVANNEDIHGFLADLEKGRPLEYINGEAIFFRDSFFVNENVLIPRNETEILVEKTAEFMNSSNSQSVLEIGTGSGCIGLSIINEVKHPIKLVLTDISEKAIEVAKINAFRLNSRREPRSEIEFVLTDRLNGITQNFDCIVSNPPYIKESHSTMVHAQVNEYEPHLALYLKDDEYMDWFKTLFTQVYEHLNEGGSFFMEGHELMLQELQSLAQTIFSSTIVVQDYTQSDRFLIAKR